MRHFFISVLSLSILSISLSAKDSRPNVIIIYTDDQGTLDANCYGSTDLQTPNIDKLADTGVRFTQAYAHTVCCPSRAALLTGRHPQRSGITSWTQGDRHGTDSANVNLPASEVTLAETLQSEGYRTALFGKWHLGAKVGHGPLDQGFDRHFGHLSGFIDNYRHYFLHGKGYHDLYEGDQEIFRRGEYFPELMVDEAIRYIDANQKAPFFAMVAFNLPHYPEQPHGDFAESYADLEMPRQAYARVVSTVDQYIGRILNKLDETGLRENTIVIFMSDNGHSTENNKGVVVENHTSGYPLGHYYSANGGGGNTGKWIGNKGTFLEGGVRVPAIISYPAKLPQGEIRDQIITAMDWYPTVLALCGIEKPSGSPIIDGHDISNIINSHNSKSQYKGVLHFGWASNWAVREGDWKLIAKLQKAKKTMIYSLHNLAEAEPELKDYAKEKPKLVTRLTKLHEQWAKAVAPR